MACDHTGPDEVISMVERRLRAEGTPEATWAGRRFGWGEKVDGMWRSIYIEIERRGENWIVTRLDRSNDPLEQTREGLTEVE